jgi:hypothetical protein
MNLIDRLRNSPLPPLPLRATVVIRGQFALETDDEGISSAIASPRFSHSLSLGCAQSALADSVYVQQPVSMAPRT